MLPTVLSLVQEKLSKHTGSSGKLPDYSSVGGGSINNTYRLTFQGQPFFCKINSATKFPHLFQKERNGLELIQMQEVIRVPRVIDCFESEGLQVLLLEWINYGDPDEDFWKKFGARLAALHQTRSDRFGLQEDNYMGSVPQANGMTNNWVEFFIDQRLQPLVDRCLEKKLLENRHRNDFENLYQRLPAIFESGTRPALLHGDLWSGNFICDENAGPVLIDPAVYYGHPSVDLAMTTLFGGFRAAFYESYHYYAPFPANYKEQWEVCNLYPLLIHLYLFGSSYRSRITETLFSFS
jgi:protein-ribulosamine 3-kinase